MSDDRTFQLWLVDPSGPHEVLVFGVSENKHVVQCAYERWGHEKWNQPTTLGTRQAWILLVEGSTASKFAATEDPEEIQLILDAMEPSELVDPPRAVPVVSPSLGARWSERGPYGFAPVGGHGKNP